MRYSLDFRIKVLRVKQEKELSIRGTARYFLISPATLNGWLHRLEAKKPGPKGSREKSIFVSLKTMST